jgi:two-component system, cell cycle response regulator DivK
MGMILVPPSLCCESMKRILLVEDDADAREVYRVALQHAGFAVLEAGNGLIGLELAVQERPDLILMDIVMPGLSGWDVARRLKANGATEHVPIVAITAQALDRDRKLAEEIRFDAYLPKPVRPSDVIVTVRRLLGM